MLAVGTVMLLCNSGRDDAQITQQVMQRLGKRDDGADGRFCCDKMDGLNLMRPRRQALVARHLMEM